jgi:hypothetical protein
MPPQPSTHTSEPAQPRNPMCEFTCPVCGGAAVEMRTGRRCVRCAFTLCDGCEMDGREAIADNE